MSTTDLPPASETIARCEERLRELGLRPERRDDGSLRILSFPYEFDRFALLVADDDPEYLYVRFGFVTSDEIKADRARAISMANGLTHRYKAIKVVVDDDGDLVVSYELFIQPDFDIAPTIQRTLDAMRSAAKEFFDALQASD